MTRAPDLTYSDDGLFVTFFAETTEGEDAWCTMAAQNSGAAKFLSVHREAILKQLRDAGYRVRRAGPPEMTLDEILAELDS